jgi:hypothetical protein
MAGNYFLSELPNCARLQVSGQISVSHCCREWAIPACCLLRVACQGIAVPLWPC